ncbi:hypothetical protein B0H10DRAFT_2245438 [Mycena sp. CBHHK59/15]|nr:hypothetical protein B0H10DRAFT_2245438 [Mycena sp. CBHHK59/15]
MRCLPAMRDATRRLRPPSAEAPSRGYACPSRQRMRDPPGAASILAPHRVVPSCIPFADVLRHVVDALAPAPADSTLALRVARAPLLRSMSSPSIRAPSTDASRGSREQDIDMHDARPVRPPPPRQCPVIRADPAGPLGAHRARHGSFPLDLGAKASPLWTLGAVALREQTLARRPPARVAPADPPDTRAAHDDPAPLRTISRARRGRRASGVRVHIDPRMPRRLSRPINASMISPPREISAMAGRIGGGTVGSRDAPWRELRLCYPRRRRGTQTR